MITADQLVAHAIGDYLLQSDWMANRKRSENIACFWHALAYGLCFLPFVLRADPNPHGAAAWLVIVGTHFLIDRYGLARYVVWAKNWLAPRWWMQAPWAQCQATGYPPERPPFLAVWLLIIADNILHVVINGLALRFL